MPQLRGLISRVLNPQQLSSALFVAPLLLVGCTPVSNSETQASTSDDSAELSAAETAMPEDPFAGTPLPAISPAAEKFAEGSRPADTSPASSLPSFSRTAYCEKIGETAGGSYQIESTCRDMEAEALSSLQSQTIPERILQYCTQIGETAGGSFQIMNTCVDMESEAASGL